MARDQAARRLAAADPEGALARCAVALERPGDDELACRLITGKALLELHRPAEAAGAIEPARGRLGILEPYGALLLGKALAAAGDARAPALLDEAIAADPRGALGRAAEVPAALALAHEGRLDEARRRLRALLAARRGDRGALRLALADASAAGGSRAEAIAIYREVWRDEAGTPHADRARVRLDELAAAGAEVPGPSVDDRIERARRLIDRGRFEAALAELPPPPSGGAVAALLRGRALSSLGRRVEAEAALAPAVEAAATSAQALDLLARSAMRAGETDRALALLDRVRGEAAAEAAFLAAFFEYDAGRFERATARFRAFLEEHGRSPRRHEAAWYLGWTRYRRGDLAGAAAEWETFDRSFPRSSLSVQVRYWYARALARQGLEKEARAVLARVVRADPASWYGQLAARRLGKGGAELAARRASAREPRVDGAVRARLDRATALYAAGLPRLAGDEIEAATEGSRDAALLGTAAALAHATRDHARAFRIAVDRLGGLSGAADLAYPEAFRSDVTKAAAAFGIEPDLVWAIMRRESSFRPHVRSAANAVGLMQILPATAARIGTLLGLPPGTTGRLEDPAVNVALGTWYVAELAGRAGGSPVLAAASYNAGPDAVASWVADPLRRDLPLDEFVDSIPWRETRGYVKAVVGDLMIYRTLRGRPPLPLPDEVPEIAPGARF